MMHSIANCWNAIGRLATAIIAGGCMLYVIDAPAAQRTFVASYGDDSNACSRVAPCRSFAVAMTYTDPGGELLVLDSAGYGIVVIAQSVSIIAPSGVYAGITAFAGENGIEVNGAGIKVTLRGLSLNGLAGSGVGVDFLQGSALHLESCVISGFGIRGVGILGPGEVFIKDSEIRDGGGRGIRVIGAVHDPDVVHLTIDRTRVENNGSHGIEFGGNVRVALNRSVVSGNSGFGVGGDAGSAGDVNELVAESSLITHNVVGIITGTAIALGINRVVVANSTISWNSIGWSVHNDPNTNLYTFGNNAVRLNNSNQVGKAPVSLGGD